jgi:polysaccharide biosynthesis/export protein
MRLKIRLAFRSLPSLPLLILILLSPIAAQSQTTTPSPRKPETVTSPHSAPVIDTGIEKEDDSYRLGPGDLLDVRVFNRPELGREVRITNQGRIRLPFLQEIQAACLTEVQLAQLITEKYKKYLRDPQIDVFVKEYKSQPVAVIGSVATPGRFQLQRRVRLVELLTFSGGPNLTSGGVVHIIRGVSPDFCETNEMNEAGSAAKKAPPGIVAVASQPSPPVATAASSTQPSGTQPSGSQPSGSIIQPSQPLPDQKSLQASVEQGQGLLLTFRLKDVLAGSPESNPWIRPGDIISLPETEQVFVIGTVFKPGPVPIKGTVTLLQAIGSAGGFLPDAAKGNVRVVRTQPGTNQRQEIIYNVNDIQRKKAEDVALLPNDVVDVPSSVFKTTARGLLAVGIGMVGYLPYQIIQR